MDKKTTQRILALLTLMALVTVAISPGGTATDPLTSPHDRFGVPALVTGHAVYAKQVHERSVDDEGEGLWSPVKYPHRPTDAVPLPGTGTSPDEGATDDASATPVDGAPVNGKQRECLVWFDGWHIDARPDPDAFSAAPDFLSDEGEGSTGDDNSMQDYSFDRDVDGCGVETVVPAEDIDGDMVGLPTDFALLSGYYALNTETAPGLFVYDLGDFAVAVEHGDCAPHEGSGFRFRGHLDFVEPNGIYHEVQEYDYTCVAGIDRTAGTDGLTSSAAGDVFPWSYTDMHNQDGCDLHGTPVDTTDLGAQQVGHIDLGHKCNGTIQDLLTERLWITRVHGPVFDPTIDDWYTFALVVDTCAGRNIYETEGKSATGPGTDTTREDRAAAENARTLRSDEAPFPDACTDGSSFSLDDTARGVIGHTQPPGGPQDVQTGVSWDDTDRQDHRDDCRWSHPGLPDGGWPLNQWPAATDPTHCLPEDHRSAQLDLYVYGDDPTGLFEEHATTRSSGGTSGDGRAVGS